jgi:hypothetical protein
MLAHVEDDRDSRMTERGGARRFPAELSLVVGVRRPGGQRVDRDLTVEPPVAAAP